MEKKMIRRRKPSTRRSSWIPLLLHSSGPRQAFIPTSCGLWLVILVVTAAIESSSVPWMVPLVVVNAHPTTDRPLPPPPKSNFNGKKMENTTIRPPPPPRHDKVILLGPSQQDRQEEKQGGRQESSLILNKDVVDDDDSANVQPPPPKRTEGQLLEDWNRQTALRIQGEERIKQMQERERRFPAPQDGATQQEQARSDREGTSRRRLDPPAKATQAGQVLSETVIRLHQQEQSLRRPPPPPRLHSTLRPPPPSHQQQQYARPFPPTLQQRQQQQQQQMKRPPPKRGPLPAGGGIKTLWQRVERGLDGLADLEDSVADRAKSFLFRPTASPKYKALLPLPSTLSSQPDAAKRRPPGQRNHDATISRGSTNNRNGAAAGGGVRNTLLERVTAKQAKGVIASIGANGGASSLPPSSSNGRLIDPKQQQVLQKRPELAAGPYSRLPVRQGAATPQKQTVKQEHPVATAVGQRRATSIYEGSHQTVKEETKRPMPRTNPISEFNAMPGQRHGQGANARPSAGRRNVNSFADDDDESMSIWSKVVSVVPPLPHFPSFSRLLGRGSNSYRMYAAASMDAWRSEEEESRKKERKNRRGLFRRNKGPPPSVISTTSKTGSRATPSSVTTPISELMSRSKHGNSTCLLSDQDVKKGRSIGKSRAALDVACLGFVLVGVKEILPYLTKVQWPHSFADMDNAVLPELRQALSLSFDSWAYFAFMAAFLTSRTNRLVYESSTRSVASSVGNVVQGAAEYGQLFLRLVAAVPVEDHVPDSMNAASRSQFAGVASAARLRNFVSMVLSLVVLITVSIVRPLVFGLLAALADIIALPQLRQLPVRWGETVSGLKNIIVPLSDQVRDLVAGELGTVLNEPLKLAFVCSVLLAMFAMSALPSVEQRRPIGPSVDVADDDDEITSSAFGNFDSVANLGTSSASRLDIYAKSGTLEGILERWRATQPEENQIQRQPSIQSALRLFVYGTACIVLATFPLFLHHVLGISSALVASGPIQVHSLVDSSILLIFVLSLTMKTMNQLVGVSGSSATAVGFLASLRDTVDEVSRSQQPSQMNLQLSASISPTKGLTVTDLWAAHTAKRAWAVRGAHVTCRNGEVVVILGDDSAGKSRLLTAISEAIAAPPRRALSTTKVRGSISLGGLDISKWDRGQVKRRVGLVLNDVRTVSDTAELVSGLTLEEILEPMDGVHNPGEPHVLSKHEKNTMHLALQMTGLSTTLLPRLPSKLSTVVTANEDELSPSPLRPRCNALSPAEWSKLLLARTLTQTILDNDNPASSDNSIEKSLIGSLLLLDDVTVHMSEVEEAQLIATLRRTGAASLVTSHKWATGRFADRIVVVKDGAIVESGTHNELLARGPQQSIYASKWHTMTTL